MALYPELRVLQQGQVYRYWPCIEFTVNGSPGDNEGLYYDLMKVNIMI